MEGMMKTISVLTSVENDGHTSVIHLYEGAEFPNLRRRIIKSELGMDHVMAEDLAAEILASPVGQPVEWTGGRVTLHHLQG
jgi:hypothetical protein